MRRFAAAAVAGLVAGGPLPGAWGQDLHLRLVTDQVFEPVYAVSPPGDPSRLFILDKRDAAAVGRIRLIRDGVLLPQPFLEVGPVATNLSNGLLCLAFAPDYAASGHFYVVYSDATGDTVVSRHNRSPNPDVADPASEHVVIRIAQPHHFHNGGWIGFGPDGFLYVSSGDGGPTEDPDRRGQDMASLLGKILRLDVTRDDFPDDPDRNYGIPADNPFVGEPALDEIWALGLREPWRCAFDAATGDLYIADVGQQGFEEVNVQSAASPGGENYGWSCREGPMPLYDEPACAGRVLVDPVHSYMTDSASTCSVTGGLVYRGSALPDLVGRYFFADWCTSDIWSFRFDGTGAADFVHHTVSLDPAALTLGRINSFGVDACGELYLCGRFNQVWKIVPATLPPDCDDDGVDDACEIRLGLTEDLNVNDVPDSCECLCERDGDAAATTVFDLLAYLADWFDGSPDAELTGDADRAVDVFDLLAFLACWFQPPAPCPDI